MESCAQREPSLPSATVRVVRAALSVGAFIRRCSGHEHDHDGAGEACSVCMQVTIAHRVFHGLAHIALALILFFAGRKKKPAKILPCCFLEPLTLISLKVQFNT
jgi:hypothetical protein